MTNCISCGNPFEPFKVPHPFEEGRFIFTATRCPECVDQYELEQVAVLNKEFIVRRAAKYASDWEALAPASYRATDLNRLKTEHPKALAVVNRPLTNRGLIIQGLTGTCKTRAMWMLLHRYFDRGMSIGWTTGPGFDAARKQAEHEFRAKEWQDEIAEKDIYFIDDWGKGEWNHSCVGVFFEIVERRVSDDKPIFMTSNCNFKETMARWKVPDDLSKPIFRRIFETSDLIPL